MRGWVWNGSNFYNAVLAKTIEPCIALKANGQFKSGLVIKALTFQTLAAFWSSFIWAIEIEDASYGMFFPIRNKLNDNLVSS